MLEHPAITQTLQTGYPYSARRQEVGEDALGKEVHAGDEILEYEDEFFLAGELSSDAVEILEMFGAYRTKAKLKTALAGAVRGLEKFG